MLTQQQRTCKTRILFLIAISATTPTNIRASLSSLNENLDLLID